MADEHKVGRLTILAECRVGMWYVSISSGKETLRFPLQSAAESEAKTHAAILADMIRSSVLEQV